MHLKYFIVSEIGAFELLGFGGKLLPKPAWIEMDFTTLLKTI